jgi:hypothetical protein
MNMKINKNIYTFKSTSHYTINIVRLLHVPATLLAIRREVHYKGYIAIVIETLHKYKVPGFKIYVLKYTLKI